MSTSSGNKSRVGLRLKEAIGGTKSLNRSADLVALTERYQAFTKKLQGLIGALRNQHGSLVRLQKTRTELGAHIGNLTRGTPLFECSGLLPSSDRPASTVCSYASIHEGLAGKTNAYADKFNQFVIDYAVEWEKVVTGRVDKGLKTAESLRRDLDHYHKKVETLRMSANQTMSKGKQVDPKTAEKLSRNEEKFLKSKQEYNKFATDLCILIEEVTERAWRDLHPMLVKLAQFDMTLADDEAKVLNGLNNVVGELKKLAGEHGLRPQARLKDLESLNPELLCTRPGGPGNLTIESGPSPSNNNNNGRAFGSSNYSSFSEPMAMPPGSVAPQGMGGFPVQVASASTPPTAGNVSRSNSYGSLSSNPSYGPSSSAASAPPMSTMEMLHISSAAAPPPTLEQVQAATGSTSVSVRSAPSSGNNWSLPPLPPSGNYRRTGSYSDYHGGGGGGGGSDAGSVMSAPPVPAPAAPPPPPPMSSPMSMYSPSSAMPQYNMYSAPPSEQPPPMYPNAYGGLDPPSASYGGNSAPSSYGGNSAPSYGGNSAPSYGGSSAPPPAHPWSTNSNGDFGGGGMGGYGSPNGSSYPDSYGGAPSSYGGAPPQRPGMDSPNNPFAN